MKKEQKPLIYIIYNKRSCKTGKALFDTLKNKGVEIRRCNKKPPRVDPDAVIRWGSSSYSLDCRELNTRESVIRASDKGVMMEELINAEGVDTPQVLHIGDDISGALDGNGKAFFRNANNQIRYRSNFIEGDKYALTSIDKVHEYRVHVFNGSVIGVYEKIPHNESIKIYKDDTCDFRRIDLSSRDNRQRIRGVRPMAKQAVESLGLLFGGVDVITDSDGNIYVLEVNSAPGLNEPNFERWSDRIIEYIKSVEI